jgi:hypothetical protein
MEGPGGAVAAPGDVLSSEVEQPVDDLLLPACEEEPPPREDLKPIQTPYGEEENE